MFCLKKSLGMRTIYLCHHNFNVEKNVSGDIVEVIRSKLAKRNPEKVEMCIKTLKELGFSDGDILQNYMICTSLHTKIEQHFHILREAGFRIVDIRRIRDFQRLYLKTVLDLKKVGYIPETINVAQSFGSYFNPQPDDGIVDYKQFDNDEGVLKDIHSVLVKKYIGWRLETTPEIVDILLRTHPGVRYKNIQAVCQNINLALEIGLSKEKILRSGYILHTYPKYTQEVLRDLNNLAGGDLKKAMYHFPKLMMVSPNNYRKTYDILKEHDVQDDTIRNNPDIFQLSPKTIKTRLEEIEQNNDLKFLKMHKRFLKLVVYYERVKSRVCYLNELHVKCRPLGTLANFKDIDQSLKKGRDENIMQDLLWYLKKLLRCDIEEIRKVMKPHPHFLKVPLAQIWQTFQFLLDGQFKIESIRKAPIILLYPKEIIDSTYQNLKKCDKYDFKILDQCKTLNLIIYHMEKEHHFTGNGVWKPSREELTD